VLRTHARLRAAELLDRQPRACEHRTSVSDVMGGGSGRTLNVDASTRRTWPNRPGPPCRPRGSWARGASCEHPAVGRACVTADADMARNA
jgi:hypothetical protein